MLIKVLMFAALLSSSHGGLLDLLNGLVRINIGQGSANRETYLGCFTDDSSRMINEKNEKGIDDLTHETCFNFCREDNYRYAGVQFSNECFCGDTIDTQAYPQRPESECNLTCSGNAEQVCGGIFRMSLFELMY